MKVKNVYFKIQQITIINAIIFLFIDSVEGKDHQKEGDHSAEGGGDHSAGGEGDHSGGGVHVFIADFSRVQIPFIIGMWIFCASLAKIGNIYVSLISQ